MTIHVETSSHDGRTRWLRTIWNCSQQRGVLLYRYYLLDTRWLGIYLHQLMTSDDDRAMHDHPWSFVSWLIGGGYTEHTPLGVRHHRRFAVLLRPASWIHRLELEQPTWTLVVRFRTVRLWGFFTEGGWMDYRSYGREFCD